MRVSQFYKLGRSQATLDFVDVDTVTDTPVFISPKALTILPSEFGDECVHAIQNFFKTILELVRTGQEIVMLNAYFVICASPMKLVLDSRRERLAEGLLDQEVPLTMYGRR